MRILVDTNILLRAVQPSHPMHASAVRAMGILMEREEALVVTVQNIAEFWNAATRPAANNGLGFTIEEAQEELARIEGFFEIIAKTWIIRRLEGTGDIEPGERRKGSRCTACRRDEGLQHLADCDL